MNYEPCEKQKFSMSGYSEDLEIFAFRKVRNFRNSGFTLLEMIVAVGILSVVVVFALSTIWRGTTLGAYATDEMTASYLAQDAMEYIRAKKNENITNGAAWLTGFKPAAGSLCMTSAGAAANCRIDTTSEANFATNCAGACPVLTYNSGTGTYSYGAGAGWTASRFTRTITMAEIVANREVTVTVTVTFRQGALTKTTRFDQNMYNVI